jgi:hypothetical protein
MWARPANLGLRLDIDEHSYLRSGNLIYQVIYSSQATNPMSLSDLEEILVDARAGNEKRNITGALLYVDGVFLQILEGDKDTVLNLIRSIKLDSRHSLLKVFHEAEIDARTFAGWRMAFLDATPEQMAEWAGLEGAASIESILEDIKRDPQRASQVAGKILLAIAPEDT